MRRLGRLRGGFAGQPSNSWNQFPFTPVLNPPGAGFAGAPSNYWGALSRQRIQYVMVPGFPSMKLVSARRPPLTASLRGLGRLGVDECQFDSDCGTGGTCGAGVCFDASVLVNDPMVGPVHSGPSAWWTQNAAIPNGPPAPPPPQPNAWQQFVDWLGQSTIPGVKNGYALAGVGLLAAVMGGRKARRR